MSNPLKTLNRWPFKAELVHAIKNVIDDANFGDAFGLVWGPNPEPFEHISFDVLTPMPEDTRRWSWMKFSFIGELPQQEVLAKIELIYKLINDNDPVEIKITCKNAAKNWEEISELAQVLSREFPNISISLIANYEAQFRPDPNDAD